jgi:hypothetical protein
MIALALALSTLAPVQPQDLKKAPDFDGGTGWLNTDKPVRIGDLKGKIVLLDFWTYC